MLCEVGASEGASGRFLCEEFEGSCARVGLCSSSSSAGRTQASRAGCAKAIARLVVRSHELCCATNLGECATIRTVTREVEFDVVRFMCGARRCEAV